MTKKQRLVARTARWAWERDEVGEPSTRQTVQYTVLMYSVALGLTVVSGAGLAAIGHPEFATALLMFGIWVFVIFGMIGAGWEWIAYRRSQRPPQPERAGPQRELAPDIQIAADTKIGFVVSIGAIIALVLSYEVALLVISLVV